MNPQKHHLPPDCTTHTWARLLGRQEGMAIPTGLHTCLTCGMLKVGTNTIRISDTRLDMDDKELRKAVLKDTGQKVNALGNVSGTTTIDLELGNVATATATGDTTFQFSNPPASGVQGELILELTNGGDHTISWPGAVTWAAGSAPTLTSSGTDTLLFYTTDGGTTWYGNADFVDVREAVIATAFTYGWLAGGSPGVTTVDRIDYSNDTATASARGPLAAGRAFLGGTGNSAFGYFGGGGGGVSTVERIQYASDTSAASAKGPLSTERLGISATGNSSFGWFGGESTHSNVDRIDYANDTATASARGARTAIRHHGATGNSSFGWFGGGNPSSTVDRVDYSNDTATASVRGPITSARRDVKGTGNSSFGYFGGGKTPGGQHSTVDRIDYSNDTATAVTKGPLSAGRYGPASTTSSSYGYFGGGTNTPAGNLTSVDRIDYSNDTATASARGPLSTARFIFAGSFHQSI